MTDEQLEQIRKREQAATEGPWVIDHDVPMFIGTCAQIIGPRVAIRSRDIWRHRSDMDFIAHARTDIPALLDEVARLKARILELDHSARET